MIRANGVVRDGVYREHTAELVARVEHDLGPRPQREPGELGLDQLVAKAECEHDFRDPGGLEQPQMPLEEAAPAEFHQAFG